jgi:hypothetical protein
MRSAPLKERLLVPGFWKSNSSVKELPQVKVAPTLISAPEMRRSPACVVVRLFEVNEVPLPVLEAVPSSGEVAVMPPYS